VKRAQAVLDRVPVLLASKGHIAFLFALGVYLIVFPLCHIPVSAFTELIGGNYANVTSDLGACIAAGGTLRIAGKQAAHHKSVHERIDSLERLFKGSHDEPRTDGDAAPDNDAA
jgi:hypothetical protein